MTILTNTVLTVFNISQSFIDVTQLNFQGVLQRKPIAVISHLGGVFIFIITKLRKLRIIVVFIITVLIGKSGQLTLNPSLFFFQIGLNFGQRRFIHIIIIIT